MVVEDGRYTGEIEFYAYGQDKAEAIRELAAQRGYDLADCYAYSDSVTDLPMLEAVGHPHAVNPDRALRREATDARLAGADASPTRSRCARACPACRRRRPRSSWARPSPAGWLPRGSSGGRRPARPGAAGSTPAALALSATRREGVPKPGRAAYNGR